MDEPDLLSCPLCGSEAEYITRGTSFAHMIGCTKCSCTAGGSAFENNDYNSKIWNRRVTAKMTKRKPKELRIWG